jgi:hypothetical protein
MEAGNRFREPNQVGRKSTELGWQQPRVQEDLTMMAWENKEVKVL